MSARTTEARDALVALIAGWWAPTAPDAVLAPWRFELKARSHAGRRVYVLPADYARENVTRAQEQGDYGYAVLVAERYATAGDPPDAWVDERVAWVESLYGLLSASDLRLLADPGEPYSGLWPDRVEVATVLDYPALTQGKLFLSEIRATFREHR